MGEELRGARVALRPVAAGDRPLLRRWFGDRELRGFIGRQPAVGPRSGQGADPHDAQFLILLWDGQRPIGVCGLFGISWIERTAEVGILLGEKDTWGHGYGPEALRVLVDHARDELGLSRISLCVHATNTRAIRAYEKVGFVVEQRLTVGRWLFGRGVEILVMALPERAAASAVGMRRRT
ncbi:MAG: hypothetical protein BIP78_0449 [Candidatus Bipolaricaulis sibiricus]|uniref:N-acetyltransferase domain-containing protein n=1 Tax=Bipolaricaulis sibiricus TaxID=2501609 RepID=A0A410FT08_BIPS1|nr:MAG: hypothetical protein BIP78_0449 [Candidatus Bipolaricaulis sibiricus]